MLSGLLGASLPPAASRGAAGAGSSAAAAPEAAGASAGGAEAPASPKAASAVDSPRSVQVRCGCSHFD